MVDGFEALTLTFHGDARQVFVAGDGPPVVVMHEIPGIYPAVIEFAERLVNAGYRVAMPQLLGDPGREFSIPYTLSSMTRACVSREFHVLASRGSSPITIWLRALCRSRSARTCRLGRIAS